MKTKNVDTRPKSEDEVKMLQKRVRDRRHKIRKLREDHLRRAGVPRPEGAKPTP